MRKLDIDIVDAMSSSLLFGPHFQGDSWNGWRTMLKAAFALPMSDSEREFFRTIAERDPPTKRVREFWIIAGRRAGKDSIASAIAAHAAALFNQHDHHLRRGERALVMCLACDRDQAKIVLSYTSSYFNDIPALRKMVTRRSANGFELNNSVDVAIVTNSFRSTRGRPVLCAIFDELAFWRDETSATPDEEVYRAIKPGMATLSDSMLIGISTPYRKAGLLYKKFCDHYGRDGDILVIRAPSTALNPTLDQAIIDQAFEEDPALASAEWMAEFRTDIDAFVSRDVIDAAVIPGRYELPPSPGVNYVGYIDPAGGGGGRGSDSMALAIAHHDKSSGRYAIDAVRERKPPFSPEDVVAEFAHLLKTYNVRKVKGDHWGGEFVRQPFLTHNLTYELAEKTASDTYRDTLPLLNSGRVELPDLPKLTTQFCNLVRITARSGKDTITHSKGQHDDLANATCGALLLAASGKQPMQISAAAAARLTAPESSYFRY